MSTRVKGYITQKQAAERLGVNKDALSKAMPYLAGFPEKEQRGKARLYLEKAVMNWAKDRDVPQLVKAAVAISRGGKAALLHTFNANCRRFITGQFAAAEQRNQIELKKLVARQCRKPVRRVVTIIPDWTQDQRGNEIPQTKIIERTV
ncbi:hypothetical protein ACH50O_11780 [Methylomonas sp. 2BW1-5-20]|uniref:hypothetical protein n=1 Tax=Methylomonas sp. 2BW1-5-20 TaxID=3376686 RepID=UPI00404E21B7